MFRFQWLLLFPRFYAFLCSHRRSVNYEKQLYLRTIKRGDIVLDLGANVGYYSILFSRLCGKKGSVHCFEPVMETYQSLLLSLRGLKNTKVNNLAVGEKETMMKINLDPANSEKSTLLKINSPKSENVKVLPIDTYVKEQKLSKVDFIKCDVEGYELQALLGMRETLSINQPKISIEITLLHKERRELISYLINLGYDTFLKVEKGYPTYDPNFDSEPENSYFYLYATCSHNT